MKKKQCECKKPLRIVKEEGTMEIVTAVLGQEKIKSEKIKIKPFVTNPMYVEVRCSRLINTGNFENVKIEISVKVPCYVEQINKKYLEVLKFVTSHMDSEIDKLENG